MCSSSVMLVDRQTDTWIHTKTDIPFLITIHHSPTRGRATKTGWIDRQRDKQAWLLCLLCLHTMQHCINYLKQKMFGLYTYTHTRLTALFPGLTRWADTRKVKPIWILLKQETVSGSGISWAICMSAPSSRQTTTPAPHHSVFYRPDALPATQPTASKHWRPKHCLLPIYIYTYIYIQISNIFLPLGVSILSASPKLHSPAIILTLNLKQKHHVISILQQFTFV